jgi:hypothetical protein
VREYLGMLPAGEMWSVVTESPRWSSAYAFSIGFFASSSAVMPDHIKSVSIAKCIEDQAFSPSYDLVPSPPPHHTLPSASCHSFSVFLVELGRGGERLGRVQIRRWRESLVLFKSFNIFCIKFLNFGGLTACKKRSGEKNR